MKLVDDLRAEFRKVSSTGWALIALGVIAVLLAGLFGDALRDIGHAIVDRLGR